MSSSPETGSWVELTCDGNRRYGVTSLQQQGVPVQSADDLNEQQAYECNNAGGNATKSIIEVARDEMVGLMALWVWSTKNWNRPEPQRIAVFRVINEFLKDLETRWMHLPENLDVRLAHMGRTEGLREFAPDVLERMERIMEYTRERTGMVVALLLDYSGPDEEERARALWKQSDHSFEDCLDLPRQGIAYRELDLRIRTGETSTVKHANAVMSGYTKMETRDIFHTCLLAEYSPDQFRNDLYAYRNSDKRNGK
jgi:undecaprenyl diphosphate synthase